MIDVNKIVREAFVSALNFTHNGTAVPVYDTFNPNESQDLYIILSTMTDADESNKTRFVTRGTMIVDIVSVQDGVSYDDVDTVAGSVMGILQPTTKTHGLTIPGGYQVLNFHKRGSERVFAKSAGRNVIRRLLRYEWQVIQN